MKGVSWSVSKRLFGCVDWLPTVTLSSIPDDVISGLVVGVMLLPQSLSYANVLEVPLTVGMNTGVVSGIAYALAGSVPFLSIGAAGEVTAFLLTAVTATGEQRAAQLLALAMAGGLVGMATSFLRGGTLIMILLNRAVGDGYLVASSILVILTQIKTAFALPGSSTSTVQDTIRVLISSFRDYSTINTLYSFLLFAAYSAYLFSIRFFPRCPKWVPHQLIVVIVSTIITYTCELNTRIRLPIVKDMPAELPTPSFEALSS